jgi:hypothetical protein
MRVVHGGGCVPPRSGGVATMVWATPGLISSVDFIFNGFNSSDMLLYGLADVESRILTLSTNKTNFAIVHALCPEKIPTKEPNSSYVYILSQLVSSSRWLLTRILFLGMA